MTRIRSDGKLIRSSGIDGIGMKCTNGIDSCIRSNIALDVRVEVVTTVEMLVVRDTNALVPLELYTELKDGPSRSIT